MTQKELDKLATTLKLHRSKIADCWKFIFDSLAVGISIRMVTVSPTMMYKRRRFLKLAGHPEYQGELDEEESETPRPSDKPDDVDGQNEGEDQTPDSEPAKHHDQSGEKSP